MSVFLSVFMSLLVFSQFSGSSMFGSIFLLCFSVSVFYLVCCLNLTWLSLLFFLIYVGGLLVLFFYVLALNSKPLAFGVTKFHTLVFLLVSSFFIFFSASISYLPLDFVFRNFMEDSSYFLFNNKEHLSMAVICLFLLYVLFVVKKFTLDTKSAMRPLKF